MSESKRDRARATDAFRRWARAGCPAADEIRGSTKGAADLKACASVFVTLWAMQRGRKNFAAEDIARAVREVYMVDPCRPMRPGDVTLRVRRLAVERYVSERMVYFWLAKARRMWIRARGDVGLESFQ